MEDIGIQATIKINILKNGVIQVDAKDMQAHVVRSILFDAWQNLFEQIVITNALVLLEQYIDNKNKQKSIIQKIDGSRAN